MEHFGKRNPHLATNVPLKNDLANINNDNNSQRAVKGHNLNVFSFIASVYLV